MHVYCTGRAGTKKLSKFKKVQQTFVKFADS